MDYRLLFCCPSKITLVNKTCTQNLNQMPQVSVTWRANTTNSLGCRDLWSRQRLSLVIPPSPLWAPFFFLCTLPWCPSSSTFLLTTGIIAITSEKRIGMQLWMSGRWNGGGRWQLTWHSSLVRWGEHWAQGQSSSSPPLHTSHQKGDFSPLPSPFQTQTCRKNHLHSWNVLGNDRAVCLRLAWNQSST